MSDDTGTVPGPTLQPDEPPWPLMWEANVDDTCAHLWETCHLLADGRLRVWEEDVVRCQKCHVPRCGYRWDQDPCMERRHHDGLHIYLSGRFEPQGGILR